MRARILIIIAVLLMAGGTAGAQQEPVRIRGTVEGLDGRMLHIETRDGEALTLMLAEPPAISGLEARTMADINQDDFIGTTAVKNDEGTWQALEVHIFPESMRGAGEGHYAWDIPESTMTNAAVTGSAASTDGRMLTLAYDGGSVEVEVTEETEIVAFTQGGTDLLVAGAAVFILAVPGPDGQPLAIAVVAETDGVKPPM